MTDLATNQATVKALIQAVLRYLSIRIRSRQELVDYLSQKTSEEEQQSQALQYLEENNLIDDEAFAKAWIESRLRHGKGDKIIAYELHQKGVSAKIIQPQLTAISESTWEEAYCQVVRKYQNKWLHLKGYQQKSKIYQVFQSRGFSSSRIDAFLKRRVE